MKVYTLGRTVNTMMAMEEVEVGTKRMEAQVHKNNHAGENMKDVAEELWMEAVVEVVVLGEKSRMEAAAAASALAPGDAMAARRSILTQGLNAKGADSLR